MTQFTPNEQAIFEENVMRYARTAKAFEMVAHLLGVAAVVLAIMSMWGWAAGAFGAGLFFWGLRRGAIASGEEYISAVEATALQQK